MQRFFEVGIAEKLERKGIVSDGTWNPE